MDRRRVDLVVGLALAAVLVVGGALSWQLYQQQRVHGQMMGSMMGSPSGLGALWPLLGALFVSVAVGGLYLVVRESQSPAETSARFPTNTTEPAASTVEDPPNANVQPNTANTAGNAESAPRARVLDLLPEDERRVLAPVLESPGITQIELRDRSNFSKSKVSQTVNALEKRGLLYRERQGRTYRIYPSDDLGQEPNRPG
ncbi:helix-turn-helix transcriptional regulator [Natronosalvus rutilus]|uniref:MarR family transcriptional regulator n=1 Tax=Natronosalvus rutilus TaxID=2953753 RepID=A0A9E7N891_9EURY|nr:MarR family transcriptional regulator [Natronosalvus rutilus]UTF52055.1 MarR family transcriptional regulator [Natronosalvus rutilus]